MKRHAICTVDITDAEIEEAWEEERIGSLLAHSATRRSNPGETEAEWRANRASARARCAEILRARGAKP